VCLAVKHRCERDRAIPGWLPSRLSNRATRRQWCLFGAIEQARGERWVAGARGVADTRDDDDGRFASAGQRSKIMVLWPASEKVGECVPNAPHCSVGKFWMCQGRHGRQADRPHPHSDRSPAVPSGARAKDVGEPGRLAFALKDATSRSSGSSEPCVILAARRVAGTDA
jgi:hypothetical protein